MKIKIYNKVISFLSLFLIIIGIALPIRYPNNFDTLVSGVVIGVLGLASFIIWGIFGRDLERNANGEKVE